MTQTIGSGKKERSALANIVIWALLAIGALIVVSWLFSNLWGIIVAVFWFGLGYFFGKSKGKSSNRY